MTSHPATVALTLCPAYRDGQEFPVSGLWDVIEHLGTEPSAYVWSPSWLLCPHGDEDDSRAVVVDAYVFTEQVDPKSHGRALAAEREWDRAEEAREAVGCGQ